MKKTNIFLAAAMSALILGTTGCNLIGDEDDSSAVDSAVASDETKSEKEDKEISSQKYVDTFNAGEYLMKYTTDSEGNAISFNFPMTYAEKEGKLKYIMHDNDDSSFDTVVVYKDGKTYTQVAGYYYVSDDEDGSSINQTSYKDLEYIDSGEVEINGKTYKCDNFKNPALNNITKLVLNDDDELYAICATSSFSTSTDDESSDIDVSASISGDIYSTIIIEDFKTSLDDSEFEVSGEEVAPEDFYDTIFSMYADSAEAEF